MNSNKQNIAANYFGSAWSAVMSIAFVPVYVRYMGLEAYGLVGIFAVLQTCMTLLDAGLTPTLSRELALLEAGARTPQALRDLIFSSELIYAVVIGFVAAGFYFAAPSLEDHWLNVSNLSRESVTFALRAMGIVVGLRWISGLYRGAFIGLQKQVWLTMNTSIFATLRGVGAAIVLALLSPTITAFFVFQGIIALAEAAALATKLRQVLPRAPRRARFNVDRLLEIWRFAASITILTLLGVMLTQFDKLVLSRLLPLETFGYYTIASTAAGAIYLLVSPLSNVSYPQFVGYVARGDSDGLAAAYHKFCQLTAIAVVPASMVLILFARQIVFVWTGNPRIASTTELLVRLLAFGNMLHALMYTPYMLQLACGWIRFNIWVNAIAAVLLLPTLYVVANRYGAIGAGCVWVCLNISYILVATPIMHRRLLQTEMIRWYSQDVTIPLLTVASGVSLLFYLFSTDGSQVRFGGQSALILIAACLSVLIAVIATPVGRKMVRSASAHLPLFSG